MTGYPQDSEQHGRPRGRGFFWLGAIALLAGLTALFSAVDDRSRGARMVQSNGSGVVLQRDRSGHYLAVGQINGVEVEFLIDTGATDVAIPGSLARELGLEFGPPVTVMTAAGPDSAWMTRLDEVRLGQLYLNNVRGTITRAPMNEVLLGMSFLRHFSLSQQGDELVIEGGT
ncbi:MAG: retropepsin-like aspartic protease family protein [Lysobacterales bacterium]